MSPASDKRGLQAQVCVLNVAFLSNRQHDNCLSSIGTSPIMDQIYNFICFFFPYIITRLTWSAFLLCLREIPSSALAHKKGYLAEAPCRFPWLILEDTGVR
jgi:hypothetical protein